MTNEPEEYKRECSHGDMLNWKECAECREYMLRKETNEPEWMGGFHKQVWPYLESDAHVEKVKAFIKEEKEKSYREEMAKVCADHVVEL